MLHAAPRHSLFLWVAMLSYLIGGMIDRSLRTPDVCWWRLGAAQDGCLQHVGGLMGEAVSTALSFDGQSSAFTQDVCM